MSDKKSPEARARTRQLKRIRRAISQSGFRIESVSFEPGKIRLGEKAF